MNYFHTDEFPPGMEISSWNWTNPANLAQEDQINFLTSAKQSGIERIFISIDDYLDVYEQTDTFNRTENLNDYENRLKLFIASATEENISIEALAGNPYWSNETHQYLPHLIVDFVEQFNAKAGSHEKFSGIHFDIEPYAQEDFWILSKKEKAGMFLSYFELVTDLNNRLASSSEEIRLTFDIPAWLDGTHPEIPHLTIEGITKPFAYHMFDELSKYPNRYITIMAYRNYARGNNGTIELIESEHTYLSEKSNTVGLIIGQETVNNDIETITFYNKSKRHLHRELKFINNHYHNSPVVKGFAIHDLSSFFALDEK